MNISTHISLFEATLLQVFLLRISLTITTKIKAPWTNNVLGEKSELMQQRTVMNNLNSARSYYDIMTHSESQITYVIGLACKCKKILLA